MSTATTSLRSLPREAEPPLRSRASRAGRRAATGSVMAAQLEGMKLAGAGGLRGPRVGWTLMLAIALTVPLAFAWTLKTYYAHGFEAMPIGQRISSMVGSQIYWSYQDVVFAHS